MERPPESLKSFANRLATATGSRDGARITPSRERTVVVEQELAEVTV